MSEPITLDAMIKAVEAEAQGWCYPSLRNFKLKAAARTLREQAAEIERLRAALRDDARPYVVAHLSDIRAHFLQSPMPPGVASGVANIEATIARIDAALSKPEGESNV